MFFHQNHYKETFDIPDINHLQNIIYHLNFQLYSLKNMKTPMEKLRKACNFTESNTPRWVFPRFQNCTNGTKSRKASCCLITWILFANTLHISVIVLLFINLFSQSFLSSNSVTGYFWEVLNFFVPNPILKESRSRILNQNHSSNSFVRESLPRVLLFLILLIVFLTSFSVTLQSYSTFP